MESSGIGPMGRAERARIASMFSQGGSHQAVTTGSDEDEEAALVVAVGISSTACLTGRAYCAGWSLSPSASLAVSPRRWTVTRAATTLDPISTPS